MFVLIPIGHSKTIYRFPGVTLGIGLTCVFFYVADLLSESDLAFAMAYDPRDGVALTLLSSMFAHAGLFHLAGNMLFLWLTGTVAEDRWGHVAYGIFYVVSGLFATAAYGVIHLSSPVPVLGASGAIAAMMGYFLVNHHKESVQMAYFVWILRIQRGTFRTSGKVVLLIWFALELWDVAAASLTTTAGTSTGGVANSAHIAGFAFGAAVTWWMRHSDWERPLLHGYDEDEAREHGLVEPPSRFTPASPNLSAPRRALPPDPSEVATAVQKAEAAIERGDEVSASALVCEVARRFGDGPEGPRLVALYGRLVASMPDVPLDDRVLIRVMRAAAQVGDQGMVVDAARRIMVHHSGSALVPRAMFNAAKAQRLEGRDDLAEQTLQKILAAWPQDPICQEVRVELGR